jgi:hypothetical protein
MTDLSRSSGARETQWEIGDETKDLQKVAVLSHSQDSKVSHVLPDTTVNYCSFVTDEGNEEADPILLVGL